MAGNAAAPASLAFVRRARPALGTLVEVGAAATAGGAIAIDAAFAAIAEVEASLSRFRPGSLVHRFNAAPRGSRVDLGHDARRVLAAAAELARASDGLFDISLGTGADAWRCDGAGLHKLAAGVSLDLGGIAKGDAVDCAIRALRQGGIRAGWVNAGGDLRVFGALALPLDLRDEDQGGVRRFATLHGGSFATSRHAGRHASVAAPRCLWADALTKVVAASGDASHPLLRRYGARAWLH